MAGTGVQAGYHWYFDSWSAFQIDPSGTIIRRQINDYMHPLPIADLAWFLWRNYRCTHVDSSLIVSKAANSRPYTPIIHNFMSHTDLFSELSVWFNSVRMCETNIARNQCHVFAWYGVFLHGNDQCRYIQYSRNSKSWNHIDLWERPSSKPTLLNEKLKPLILINCSKVRLKI